MAFKKGATIEVNLKSEEILIEYRSQELNKLILSYDSRHGGFISSATGTVFTTESFDSSSEIFIPFLNVSHKNIDALNEGFEKFFGVSIGKGYVPNFLIVPFPIKKYLESHLPFENDFRAKHDVSYKTIIFIITALCLRYLHLSLEKEYPIIVTVLQRGYEGPIKRNDIFQMIHFYEKATKQILGNGIDTTRKELRNAFRHLMLDNRHEVNLLHSSSKNFLVPVGEDRFYIDYSASINILNNLFFGIDLNKHNFRGQLFEDALNSTQPYLPTKPCKNYSNEKKQIDFSIRIENVLILGECKVVARSTGFYTGDFNSLKLRTDKVIEKGLTEADDKANWLAKYPIGKNYNLDGIDYILPIAISPFKEFIDNSSKYYWINDQVPRVLTVEELKTFIKEAKLEGANNLVSVPKNKQ
ncbi:MAG: hypothetical protein EOO15_17980 [Chitinophagaceae bacterium]|nr:MAG: hypothetical protein EOO15_17980 [Chitinophagaceae bacterium]